jgi:hypothetical protein
VPDLTDLSREELLAHGQAQEVRIAELTGELEQVRGAHAELTAAHEQLRTAYDELAAKVAKLEHLLSRNSGNSSMPPSSDDGPGRTPPQGKGRATPKRAKGKQRGAPGTNLSWSDAPDDHKRRFPQGTCGCGADLAAATDLGVVDAFQQIEIPTVRAAVTQYDQHAVRCRCGKVHTAARPDGAGTGKVEYGPLCRARHKGPYAERLVMPRVGAFAVGCALIAVGVRRLSCCGRSGRPRSLILRLCPCAV